MRPSNPPSLGCVHPRWFDGCRFLIATGPFVLVVRENTRGAPGVGEARIDNKAAESWDIRGMSQWNRTSPPTVIVPKHQALKRALSKRSELSPIATARVFS